MPSAPFIVLDRSTRRVIHQARTLAEARGYSEARDEPTRIGIIPEVRAGLEWSYVFQAINADTGEVLAESSPMEFDDAAEILCSVKVMLVPACMAAGSLQKAQGGAK